MFKKGSFDVLDIGTVWPTARVLSNLLHQEWNIFFITNLQKAATDSSWNMVHVVVVVIEIPTKRNSFHLFLPYDSMAVIKFYIFYMGFLDKSWQILIEAPCIPARPAALESAALLTASAPPMLGTPGDAWNCMRTFWWFTSSTAQGGGSIKDRKI